MNVSTIKEIAIQGKTYSLFGNSNSTEGYFEAIDKILDDLIPEFKTSQNLLKFIQKINSIKWLPIKHHSSEKQAFSNRLKSQLEIYTPTLAKHLKELSFWKKLNDQRLGFREEQYYFSMLEIALLNKLNKEAFLNTDYKVALLPHCLKDLNANCKSENDGFDMICKSCSKNCFINHASKILMNHNVAPYIWMRSDFKKLGLKLKRENKSLGILGIACIPELMAGMRKCQRYGIPVIGLPLNANRCARWFGEFYPNSVSLKQLDRLIVSTV